ncbi:response regulator transcription factor [Magnetospirillum sulfuroxidans]|uniref:Response regulator transcription factor n=1 Tax=Magnetospirillum sulfuroxidans TaxID=611300 RepID=A0ABS5I9U0_9PROT|nr:response regulator transcription factor [Magnetospirillum sulfuroxidans]MBR9971089.1 response regulator transcription factor [Magnetospirillum sulfuroxidans]
MTRIIIAEDEVDLLELLQECLNLLGFETVGVGSALALFRELATSSFDVAIIDVGLPDQSGYDIVEVLSKRPDMGVIMLTARGGTEDRIRGFASGADLYFVKPVDCRELGAAIHSLVRRLDGNEPTAEAAPPPPAKVAPAAWTFDRTRWILRTHDAIDIDLTSAEVMLLEKLLRQPGETASRQELLRALGYEEDEAGNRNLEAIVRRLRRKVETVSGGKAPIQTVHSRGYLFSAAISVISV